MRAFLQKHLDDGLILAGCSLITWGAWMQWGQAGAAFTAGGLCIALGLAIGIGNGRNA